MGAINLFNLGISIVDLLPFFAAMYAAAFGIGLVVLGTAYAVWKNKPCQNNRQG